MNVSRADLLRRLRRCLLLAIFVVAAQQSALVHEIGHGLGQKAPAIAGALAQELTPAGADAGLYCQKCFQFAHVAGAVAAHAPAPLWLAAGNDVARANLSGAAPADTPQSRSRGPPVTL